MLEEDHRAVVENNEKNQLIYDLLEKVNVADKMFDDGIIESYVETFKKRSSQIKVAKPIFQSIRIPPNKPYRSNPSDLLNIQDCKNQVSFNKIENKNAGIYSQQKFQEPVNEIQRDESVIIMENFLNE